MADVPEVKVMTVEERLERLLALIERLASMLGQQQQPTINVIVGGAAPSERPMAPNAGKDMPHPWVS